MFVLDSHCDTPSQLLRLRDLSQDNSYGHVDFPKLKRGGVDGAFFALYTSASLSNEEANALAVKMLDAVEKCVSENADKAALALTPEEALSNKKRGLFSVMIGMENGSPIGTSLDILEKFFKRGVRYMTLCHSGNNEICDSCAPEVKKWHGLSPFGREVIAKMNAMGMMIDVSHISDESFWDVLEYSAAPVVATHSCCRALCNHPRNMTDEMIVALAQRGGLIQINFYPAFLDDNFRSSQEYWNLSEKAEELESYFKKDPTNNLYRETYYKSLDQLNALERPSYKRIVDHIDHVVDLVGIDHVGLGSDFDGIDCCPEGLENASFYPRIFEELSVRGYNSEDISKIAGENFLTFWSKVLR